MIAFRPALVADRQFIISGWSTSFKTAHAAGMIATSDWAAVMHPQIEKVLNRPDCVTLVAYEPDEDPGVDLYGFISGDPTARLPVVFYAYVKGPQRCSGIGRALFGAIGIDPAKPFVYTCHTPMASRLRSKIPLAKANPLLARYPKSETTPRIEYRHGR